MRIFFLFLSVLFLVSCQNTTKENKSEAEAESEEQEVVGFDDPLVIDFSESMKNLCLGNVRREFERVNNRYVEFDALVSSIYRTSFDVRVPRFDHTIYNYYYFTVKADKDVLVSIDKGKKYKFRGVFTFTKLNEGYCSFEYIEINDALIVEELIDSK